MANNANSKVETTAQKAAEIKRPEVKASTVAPTVTATGTAKEETKNEIKKEETTKKTIVEEAKETTAAVKETASRAVRKVKKAAKEKEKAVPEVVVQFNDEAGLREVKVEDVVAKVKAKYVGEHHRESSIKSLQVYVKPQEYKAYYVINDGKDTGEIYLF